LTKAFEYEESDSILVQNIVYHQFSTTSSKDKFHIYLKGKSVLDGIIHFKIYSNYNEEIFIDIFPSIDLIGYGLLGESASKQDEENYIKKRITEFFIEDNFISPAISKYEEYDPDYSEREIWEDIKSDESAIGFYYLTGEEDGKIIAWSKSMKKVVLYFNCC